MLRDQFLLSLAGEQKRHIWIGNAPELSAPVVNLFNFDGFRAPAEHHANYDIGWCYEMPLDIQGWRIFLDSVLQLLANKARLVVRYTQNFFITIPAVKNYLFRKYGIRATLLYESQEVGIITDVFEIERTTLHLQRDTNWTFGVLTQNTKVDTVRSFCESVRKYGGAAHQIIICAPEQHTSYDDFQVEYITKPYSASYAEISLKKNDIIALSRHQNIMLVHDRYVLNEDFFTGFEKYGYDFEYTTILQRHESGKVYPGYCAIQDFNQLIWGELYAPQNDKEQWILNYINGGLIIAKKHVLEAFPFNPMLFHHQAEDVELARVMKQAGIIARENRYSSSVTNAPDHVTDCFRDKPNSDYYRSVYTWIHGFYLQDAVIANSIDRLFIVVMEFANALYRGRFIHRRGWIKVFSELIKARRSKK